MIPRANQLSSRLAVALASAAILVAGCGSSNSTSTGTTQQQQTGPSFVVGTDAPMASVVSFAVQLQSIDAITSSGTSVPLLSGTPTVDFARFNGLQTLIDMNDVPAGTYNSVSITLGTGTIGYLNMSGGAPAIETMNASFTNPTVTIDLNNPLVVQNGGAPVGLRVDFDLAQSIQTDTNGNITGQVNPNFDVRAVTNADGGAYIDSFIAAVVSVGSQSFVVQGPHGENFTINVNGNTEWDGDASLSTLNTSSIVELSGQLDRADQTLDADEVAVLTDSGFYARGQITYVTPSSGAAPSFELYVRGLLPTDTGLNLGQIATVDLTGNEKYFIYWMHNKFTNFLFNSSSLVAGQDVSVGGPASGAASSSDVSVKRIHLRNWGFNGTIVGTPDPTSGTFQMQVNGFAGVLIPQTVTVYLGPACDFRYGLGGFSDLGASVNVRVVGLLLKDPISGNLVLLARHVDGTNFTDMATAAWQ
ncbi:MAG TPA: DUF4382 domain-containing protein [Terracidiphilus sp.]|nr:DUF4382 domain-containing protein [Terracidiphilus sp.]